MLKYVIFFLPFFAILTNINYYQARNLPPSPRAIFIYTLLLAPAFLAANFGINYIFNIGLREINKIWHINIYLWTANFINIAFFSYFWFNELPTFKTLLAAVLVVIAILLVV